MPFQGSSLFLLTSIALAEKTYETCQCPFRALLYFYTKRGILPWNTLKRVNALSGLFFISTSRTLNSLSLAVLLVSMPFQGSSLFLLAFTRKWRITNMTVSMPFQGSSLFLQTNLDGDMSPIMVGVNALSGLFFISTRIFRNWNKVQKDVSMPFQGSSLFLRSMILKYEKNPFVCQCPFRALLYFY